jgi:hypothetical protein
MIIPGGTPFVTPPGTPTCITTYAARPSTAMWGETVMTGSVTVASVQGTMPGPVWGQPTMGMVRRSGAQSGKPPPTCTAVCVGLTIIRPPWLHMICAFEVRIAGTTGLPDPNEQK